MGESSAKKRSLEWMNSEKNQQLLDEENWSISYQNGKVAEIRKDTVVSGGADDATSDSTIWNHISPQKRADKGVYFVRKMPLRNMIIGEHAGPSSSNVLMKEPKIEQFDTPIDLNKSPNRASNKMRVLRRLNWDNRRNRQLIALQKCQAVNKVVKDEPIEVKEEPIDDYELPVTSHQLIPGNPTETEDVPKVEIPVFKPEKPTSVYEPPGDRIFLGAEEPMKDSPGNKIEEISRTAQNTVKRFTKSQLLPFGKRPAPIFQDGELKNSEARSRSAVLIDEVERLKESADETELDVQQLIDSRKAKLYESVRQKQAKAQKLTFNESRVIEYMNSEIFKKSIEPPDDSSSFEKIVKSPDVLTKYPAYSDSLLHSSPVLFKNLERVHDMQRKDPSRLFALRDRLYNAPKKRIYRTVQLKCPILPKKKEVQLKDPDSETIEMFEIAWKGNIGKVPEFIQCHLCNGTMRFCVRSRRFRGEVREHKTYRCFRKGCQTYCSVKKVVNMNHWGVIPDDPKEFIIKEVGKLKSEPPEIAASKEDDEEEDDEECLGETIGYRYISGSSDSYSDLEDHVETGIPFPPTSYSKREVNNNKFD